MAVQEAWTVIYVLLVRGSGLQTSREHQRISQGVGDGVVCT